MKAIVYDRYGSPDVLRLEEVSLPTVGPRQVLIRIRSASVNSWDWENLTGASQARPFWGFFRPRRRILGADVAGVIEAVGEGVTRFRPGDEVFGDLCECGWGAFAEFVCAAENALEHKPSGISFEAAAAIPQAGVMAWLGVHDYGGLRSGQRVLINGAGGAVGSFAIQLAKAIGAEISAVDAPHKFAFMRSLGADQVIDYQCEDLSVTEERYDLIVDVRAKRPMAEYRRLLRPTGKYFLIGGDTSRVLEALAFAGWLRISGSGQRMGLVAHKPNKDLCKLAELVASGKLVPQVDRVFPLNETAEALRMLGDGRTLGKVVVSIQATEHA